MNNSAFADLLSTEFVPLFEAKAKLSQQIQKISRERKSIAVTVNGRPRAILLDYDDYLKLLRQAQGSDRASEPVQTIDYQAWKQGEKNRLKVRDSILNLFDMQKLSRKGQKSYKKEIVHEFGRRIKKTTA